jgi:hypothetical protein
VSKQHYFPESYPLIFDFFIPFYVASGSGSRTVMHSGSGPANIKNFSSCGSGSTTLLRLSFASPVSPTFSLYKYTIPTVYPFFPKIQSLSPTLPPPLFPFFNLPASHHFPTISVLRLLHLHFSSTPVSSFSLLSL